MGVGRSQNGQDGENGDGGCQGKQGKTVIPVFNERDLYLFIYLIGRNT